MSDLQCPATFHVLGPGGTLLAQAGPAIPQDDAFIAAHLIDQIDEAAIAGLLQTHDLPPLDLLIRTSGEVRLSNFLLWQGRSARRRFTCS